MLDKQKRLIQRIPALFSFFCNIKCCSSNSQGVEEYVVVDVLFLRALNLNMVQSE